VGVDGTGIEVEDAHGRRRRIESVCKVWAAGVSASPLGVTLAEQSGAGLDRAGRIEVLPDLTLPGHPEVFVVGDMIALNGLPGVAQVAIQGGRYAAGQIVARLAEKSGKARLAEKSGKARLAEKSGKARLAGKSEVARLAEKSGKARLEGTRDGQPFEYHDKGSMATISRLSAVASIGPLRLSGFIAWLMWLGLHLAYMVGFKNRLTTLLHWAVSFVGRGRSERTVTEQQIFARQALEQLGADFAPTLSPRPVKEPPP
jgi:NADH dehydrogenase